jgi:hypothetical protein
MDTVKSILVSAMTNPRTIETVKGNISQQVARLPQNRVDAFSTAWSHLNDAVNVGVQQAKTNPATTPAPALPSGGKRKKRNHTRKLKRKSRK